MSPESSIERGLAEALVQQLQRDLPNAPPVDLHRVASHLGVTAVRWDRITEEGRTVWGKDGPVITLRTDRPPARSRFTFAHELAHVLLATDGLTRRRRKSLHSDDEEILCDWIAAALLMPRGWVRPYAERDRYTLSLLRLVAQRAEVSLSAAAVRLSEVGRRPCILLRWRREDRWILAGQAGVPRDLVGYFEVTADTSSILDRMPNRRDTWQALSLTLDGAELRGRAHVDRQYRTCLTLFTELDRE